MTRMTGPDCAVMFNLINTHTHTHTPREDQCEWHRMTRMTGPDCVVMCNLINTHTHTRTLALPLTFSLPSRFAPSARLVVCVSPRALCLSLSGDSSCDCLVWDKRGGGFARQPVGPPVGTAATMIKASTGERLEDLFKKWPQQAGWLFMPRSMMKSTKNKEDYCRAMIPPKLNKGFDIFLPDWGVDFSLETKTKTIIYDNDNSTIGLSAANAVGNNRVTR